MLPALALGAEPPNPRNMQGTAERSVVDRRLLWRAFGVLGAAEALASMGAFAFVLLSGGWRWGEVPSTTLLALSSGTAFAAILIGQMANAFACRSSSLPVWRLNPTGNRPVWYAVAAELVLMTAFLRSPGQRSLLGAAWPETSGWAAASLASVAVLVADSGSKAFARWRRDG